MVDGEVEVCALPVPLPPESLHVASRLASSSCALGRRPCLSLAVAAHVLDQAPEAVDTTSCGHSARALEYIEDTDASLFTLPPIPPPLRNQYGYPHES